jgi:peptidoglycan/xylan/chitin deacetylase (PgdA/CDA1 family)
MDYTRREFLVTAGTAVTACMLAKPCHAAANAQGEQDKKKHIVTLSFDDGFQKSSLRTAEIYEKYKLSACINVIATEHQKDFVPPDEYQAAVPKGDFGLWNELQQRSHEIMPHGYKHANKRNLPFGEAQDLILRCLDVFVKELKGFEPKQAVFNFPYNASTPELERWLPTQVRAFRAGGKGINPLPYQGQVKLAATGYGPGNCEHVIEQEIEKLLVQESGWLIFNTHGLEDEGWGPIRASFLERLLERLLTVETLDILPAGRALRKYAG